MTAAAIPPHTPSTTTVTVHVPMSFHRRGGRKVVIVPADQKHPTLDRTKRDGPFAKAVARAHRWRRLLDSGQFVSISELARAEKVDRSYLCKVLRLTLLAPYIVEAILDPDQGKGLNFEDLLTPFPHEWAAQRDWFYTTEGVAGRGAT